MGNLAPEPILPTIKQEEGFYVVIFGAHHKLLNANDGPSALSYWFNFLLNRDFHLLAIGP